MTLTSPSHGRADPPPDPPAHQQRVHDWTFGFREVARPLPGFGGADGRVQGGGAPLSFLPFPFLPFLLFDDVSMMFPLQRARRLATHVWRGARRPISQRKRRQAGGRGADEEVSFPPRPVWPCPRTGDRRPPGRPPPRRPARGLRRGAWKLGRNAGRTRGSESDGKRSGGGVSAPPRLTRAAARAPARAGLPPARPRRALRPQVRNLPGIRPIFPASLSRPPHATRHPTPPTLEPPPAQPTCSNTPVRILTPLGQQVRRSPRFTRVPFPRPPRRPADGFLHPGPLRDLRRAFPPGYPRTENQTLLAPLRSTCPLRVCVSGGRSNNPRSSRSSTTSWTCFRAARRRSADTPCVPHPHPCEPALPTQPALR